MPETSSTLCSPIPIVTSNNNKPMLTRHSGTPVLVVPNWRTTLTAHPVRGDVPRLTRLAAQSSSNRSEIPSQVQQHSLVPSIRVNFLPAFVPRVNRYSKIYNVRQSMPHLSSRRNINSPITVWARCPSPPPCIPEEDEYELDDDDGEDKGGGNNQKNKRSTPKMTRAPSPVDPKLKSPSAVRKRPSICAGSIGNISSSLGPQVRSTPNLLSRGVYWPDTPVTSFETGPYGHRLGILTTPSDSDRIGMYKTKENYDHYWFGSGSDLLLLQSLSTANSPLVPASNVDCYDPYYDNAPVVVYSNVRIPVSAYVFIGFSASIVIFLPTTRFRCTRLIHFI